MSQESARLEQARVSALAYLEAADLPGAEAQVRQALSRRAGLPAVAREVAVSTHLLVLSRQLPAAQAGQKEALGWHLLERLEGVYSELAGLEEARPGTAALPAALAVRMRGQYYETAGLILEELLGDWEEAMRWYALAVETGAPVATARQRLANLEQTEEAMLYRQGGKEAGR